MATPSHNNAFLIFKLNSVDHIRIEVEDTKSDFLSLSFPPNTWHSMCATWHSDNGLVQLWVDGKATIKRFIRTGTITGEPITILGQEQDSYGKGFDAAQSFIGLMTDVHMWDYVLSTSELKRYMDHVHFTAGNVFNWRALEYTITGQVLVEEQSEVM